MNRRDLIRYGGVVIGGGLLAGCTAPTSSIKSSNITGRGNHNRGRDIPEWQNPSQTPADYTYGYETVVENLDVAWDAVIDSSVTEGGDIWFTERAGTDARINRISADGDKQDFFAVENAIDAETNDEMVWWVKGGEGGVMGIDIHPDYPDDPSLYAYFTYNSDEGVFNKVVRFNTDNPESEPETIIKGIPGGKFHNGGRIEFGPDGYLWITTGVGENNHENARDLTSLGGKILRVNPDGSPPEDNPELSESADDRIFTYGHRNPQGIAWLPDGTPVISEHGPTDMDEISLLEPGDDYGWNEVRAKPDDDNGFESYAGNPDVHPPIAFGSSWAPSGATFYDGEEIEGLGNHLLVANLWGQQITVISFLDPILDPPVGGTTFDAAWTDQEYTATAYQILTDELGRIRHVTQGPDGDLYALTSNMDGRSPDDNPFPKETDDRIVRIYVK